MITDDLPLFAPYADKLQTGWLLCKEKHPQLLRKCYELCVTAKRRGIERWSADAMFHVLRWETAATTGDLALKINNNYSALAARDLMAMHPELAGFSRCEYGRRMATTGRSVDPSSPPVL